MTTQRLFRDRPVTAVLFFVCVAGALGLVFLPIGWQINRFIVWLYYEGIRLGVPGFVTIPWYEFGLNVLLFAVPTLLAGLLWDRLQWWQWPLIGLALSLLVELVQFAALPREFSYLDIVANTAGSLVGAGLAGVVRLRPRG